MQAVSDRAQLSTIAFSGLAFLAGDFGGANFMPPGKVCDFFGFQYMRDIDAAEKWRNPMFLSRMAANVMHILNEGQRKLLSEMIEVRTAISTELRKFLAGRQADKQKVLALGRRYGELDGEVSWMYASAFARVNRTLTAEQRATMMKLRNLDG